MYLEIEPYVAIAGGRQERVAIAPDDALHKAAIDVEVQSYRSVSTAHSSVQVVLPSILSDAATC